MSDSPKQFVAEVAKEAAGSMVRQGTIAGSVLTGALIAGPVGAFVGLGLALLGLSKAAEAADPKK